MDEIFSMTNSSKLIELDGHKYILRIAGKGTEKLVNRKEEKEVYDTIKDLHISDEVLYFDEATGTKITRFIKNGHTCDNTNDKEMLRCIAVVKKLHKACLHVNHTFDLDEKIDYYEKLMKKSKYEDYEEVKTNVKNALSKVYARQRTFTLCHIDPNQDNFVITDNDVKLIDWEYAAMQDPLLDVAMFCIYAMYDRQQIDHYIELWFKDETKVSKIDIAKIYAYIAAGGLLWSNWCEYKNQLGQEFGGVYELSQYNYAKEYSKVALQLFKEINNED